MMSSRLVGCLIESARSVAIRCQSLPDSINWIALPFFREVAFPYADHFPSFFAERSGNHLVALKVTFQFGRPPFSPMLWTWCVLRSRTTVPETSINKYGETRFRKYEVGLAEDLRISSPTGDVRRPKQRDQSEFRFTISAAPNAQHYRRPLLRCENVSHLCWATIYLDRGKPELPYGASRPNIPRTKHSS